MMNEYEPDNILQSLWDMTTRGGCLCTMRESCSWCDYSASQQRKEIEKKLLQQAKDVGYQLYLNGWHPSSIKPVDYEYVTKTYGLI